QANDALVNASKPVLLRMGKEFQPNGIQGQLADQQQNSLNGTVGVAGGVHDTNPALVLDNQRLEHLALELQHNLAIIESALADPTKFPAQTKTDDDKTVQYLRAQLQTVADHQRNNLNVIYGLTDTFSMQDLIAKGDGTQGVLNSGNGGTCPANDPNPCGQTLSHNDQDVSFKDPIAGSAQANPNTPTDPTVNKDPAISQPGTDLSNNPMTRFYLGVTEIQRRTVAAEEALGQTLKDVTASCGP
ncbi:MAG TPA: hypothetical protein VF741_08585, partial [Candidatus Aquilonibacter sp.]